MKHSFPNSVFFYFSNNRATRHPFGPATAPGHHFTVSSVNEWATSKETVAWDGKGRLDSCRVHVSAISLFLRPTTA
jgi:hypothetical protein